MKVAAAHELEGIQECYKQAATALGLEGAHVFVSQPRPDERVTVIISGTLDVWGKHLDGTEYERSQTPEPKIPGKVYMWDCCTISGKCFRCQYYHKPSEGTDPHKCPFGLKQRLRRIG